MSTHALLKNLERLSCPALIAIALAAMLTLTCHAQDEGSVQRIVQVRTSDSETRHIHSWIDLHPDGRTVLLSPTQSFPFRVVDVAEENITHTFDAGNWFGGARCTYSRTGRYVLLEQLFYVTWKPDKVKAVKYEVVEVATGKKVFSGNDLYAAELAPDERTLYTLGKDGLHVVDLATGERDKVRSLPRLGYALAVSTDGTRLAVAHQPTREELAALPTVRNDKKLLKQMGKRARTVTVYDAAALKPLHQLNEPFDEVFRLRYSPDGRDLWVMAKPHTKHGSNLDPRQRYLSVADASSGEMRRTTFPAISEYDPDFRISPDGKLLAIGSMAKFQEIHLYDRATGRMVDRFIRTHRFRDATPLKDGEFGAENRVSFCFLPDGKRIWLTFGTRLIEWTYQP